MAIVHNNARTRFDVVCEKLAFSIVLGTLNPIWRCMDVEVRAERAN